jgi:hypothetical protein
MRTLRIEIHRGHGWELHGEGRIPAGMTAEQIERDLQAYAVQHPHRALIDGVEVARAGKLPASAKARSAFDALMTHRNEDRR